MGEAGGVDVRFPVNVLKPLGLHRHCSGTAFAKVAVDAVEHQGWRPSDQISCPSDRVRKCGGVESGTMNVLASTCHRAPLLYGADRSGAATIVQLCLPIMTQKWQI
jgi:hypothetical protein